MSSIQGLGGSSPVNPINYNPTVRPPSTDPSSPALSDKVELSGVGHLLSKLKTNDIRADKVASVKSAIESGTYESDDKLNGAIDKLLDDLNK